MNMHEMNKQIDDQVVAAREMLLRLESALRKCGYHRSDLYNSRLSEWGKGGKYGVCIEWTGTKIFIFQVKAEYRGKQMKAKDRGKTRERVPVVRMNEYQLLAVAHHLEGFVDHLEQSTRHMLKALVEATEKLQDFVARIEADPQPAA